ncbi:MAG: glycosyltransferase [Chitinophagaceae bacterium]|nr:glycosyltransferase [Chitinophagaceae bacterium]
MDKHLHIVCLDVPYPVNYGGVFDLFYKIRALHELGVRIHLHCFEYGRGEQTELNKYCEYVNYYTRNEGHKGFSHCVPYIVASRNSPLLIENLLKDDFPILLEGVHCTWPLHSGKLNNRKVLLRLHNVEHEYYYHLFRHERSLVKKAYFFHESRLLKCYEQKLANSVPIVAVSDKDVATYKREFNAQSISQLPVFIPFTKIESLEGLGSYCLYHGNLSVAENEKAAIWLLEEVFSKIKVPFVVAGKDPSQRLLRVAHQRCHTCLVENPGEQQMKELIAKAQINILPSFNETGIKLKLLNALYNGRHCVVNDATVSHTGLEAACHIGNTPQALQEIVMQLYHHVFGEEEIRLRERLLYCKFDNHKNAHRLIRQIYG